MKPHLHDPIKVEAVTSLEAFDRCATEWDAAVHQAPFASVQARHFWIRRWLTTIGAGRPIAFQIMRDGAGIVGCAAWTPATQRVGFMSTPVLRLAGQPVFKRSQIVLVRRHAQAVSAMLDDLRRLRWRWFDPGLLTDGDPLLSSLPALAGGVRAHERSSYLLPLVAARGNWDSYFATRSRTIRKQHRRRLASEGLTTRVFPGDLASVDELLAAVEHVGRRSWSFDEGTSVVSTAPHWQFWQGVMRDAAARGILHAACHFQADRPVAFIFGIRQNGILHALKTSFDPDHAKLGPGQAVICSLLQMAMEHPEIETVDLDCIIGRGDYKLDWATEIRTMRQYYAFRCGPLPNLFMHAYQLKKHFAGKAPRLPVDIKEAAT
ncbi:GNAT family N-acetyltransferase [Microvirga pakistanensis]|uniref:GNAT family N-acetyltransferase n=1 Tax=Microvirga pakistanensis TaxID=1682650 RepID=UPI00106C8AF4|nr:GNAT family N-acetyltransferase [Microvirga pakistanensis]